MKTSFVVSLAGGVALAVAVVVSALFYFTTLPGAEEPRAGLTQSNVGEFPEGVLIGQVAQRYYTVSLPAGIAQASYRNTSGRTQFVDLANLTTNGIASSTQTITVGTSTSATFNGYSVPPNVKTLLNCTLATSTPSNTNANSTHGTCAVASTGGVVRLADGEYLNIGLYQTFGNVCTGALCETSTSTNRGFTVSGFIRVLQAVP